MSEVVRLEDDKLEAWITGARSAHLCPCCAAKSGQQPNWRPLLQYAVNHTVCDYYSLPAAARSTAKAAELANRRCEMHALRLPQPAGQAAAAAMAKLQSTVAGNLSAYLAEGELADAYPMVLFEQLRAPVEELQVELSMIVHALYVTPSGGYRFRKFFVDDRPEAVESYRQIATAFCCAAFRQAPELVEAIGLVSGRKYQFAMQASSPHLAVDYLRLVRDCWLSAQSGSCPAPVATV